MIRSAARTVLRQGHQGVLQAGDHAGGALASRRSSGSSGSTASSFRRWAANACWAWASAPPGAGAGAYSRMARPALFSALVVPFSAAIRPFVSFCRWP